MFRRFNRRDHTAVDALCDDVRSLLALDEEACVSINEVNCGHAVCGEIETIILLLRPQMRTQSFCIKKPLREVTRDDLAAAFAVAPI